MFGGTGEATTVDSSSSDMELHLKKVGEKWMLVLPVKPHMKNIYFSFNLSPFGPHIDGLNTIAKPTNDKKET